MDRPTIFVKRGDRLIARLKHIFYAWRFAHQIGGRVVAVWPPLPAFWHQFDGVNYSPSLIFDLRQFYARGGGDELLFLEGAIGYPPDGRTLRGPQHEVERVGGFARSDFDGSSEPFYESDLVNYRLKDEPRSADHLRTTLRDRYQALPHDPVFARVLRSCQERLGADGYTGLHVRRGDVMEMIRLDLPKLADDTLTPQRLALLMGHYVCRTALDESYYDEIEQAIRSGQRLVFFSDTPSSIEHFARTFGAKHFVDAERFRARYPIQKAFLDFNLLIGASRIIGTGSNYASFASLLGSGDIVNVVPAGRLDRLEESLYENYLAGVQVGEKGRKMLRNELERQYSRRSSLRPLESD